MGFYRAARRPRHSPPRFRVRRMIHAYRWADDCPGGLARLADLPPAAALPADTVVWVDLDTPTPAEADWAFRHFFLIHRLTLEAVTKPRRPPEEGAHLPKVEEFRGSW